MFYLNTLGHYFLADDFIFLSQLRFEQPSIPDNLVYFGRDWGVGAQFYRPLTRLLWAVEYGLFGQHATGWHLVSVLLYTGNVALLYLAAWLLTRRWPVALAAALLFTLHPAHAEPVSWIATQSDLLATLGSLAALIFYIQARQATDGPRARTGLFLAPVCFGLALLTKEAAAGFFLIPLLYELVFRPAGRWRRTEWLRLLGRFSPFVVVLGLLLLLRLALFGGLGGYDVAGAGVEISPVTFFTSYSGWLFSPVPLHRNLLRLLFVLALAGLALLLFRQEKSQTSLANRPNYPLGRLALFGLGWTVVFLLPTVTTPPSLRLVYLSSCGVAWLAAALLVPAVSSGYSFSSLRRWPSWFNLLKLAALVLLLFLAAGQAWTQQGYWADASRLSRSILGQIYQARPQLVNYSRVYAAGLPDYNEAAPIFLNGFPYAVRLLYSNQTLEGVSAPAIPIIEQQLLQTYLIEYAGERIQVRDDIVEALKQRNINIKERREQPYAVWDARAGWARLSGEGGLEADGRLKIAWPGGGTLRAPFFKLEAPALSYFELKARALPQNPETRAVQAVVHWRVETPGGTVERASAPLVIEADGRDRTYAVKPPDMSPFFLNDIVSEIHLELPSGLKELDIEQARLLRLP